MKGKNLNVFIVDDEASVIEWIQNNIEFEIYNCKIVGSSTNAMPSRKLTGFVVIRGNTWNI